MIPRHGFQEVAETLGVGVWAVRRWIRAGELKATMPYGRRVGYLIEAEDVARLHVKGMRTCQRMTPRAARRESDRA